MKNKPILTLVSDNPKLKIYYVPFTHIEVDFYPVQANSPEQAIRKANAGKYGSISKKFTLQESHTNEAYKSTHIPDETILARQIDNYSIDIKNFDYPLPSNGS